MNDIRSGNITITGLSALEDELLQYSDKMAKNILGGAIKEGAKVIQKAAKNNVNNSKGPHNLKVKGVYIKINPGNLKKFIRVKFDRSGTRRFKINYEVYVKQKTAWYWRFVELGASHMAAQSFMRNAFESEKENAVEVVAEYITSRLEKNK